MPSGLLFNLTGRDVSASSTVNHLTGAVQESGRKIKDSFTGIGKQMLAGAGIVGLEEIGSKSIEAADQLEGSNIKIEHVFGESSDAVEKWAQSLGTSFGLSQAQAESTAGSFAQILKPLGAGTEATAGMSEKLVELTQDMARFNNADPAKVQAALTAGLRGRATMLRQYGVDISNAAVTEEAYREGIAKEGSTLTDAQKTQAAYNLILQQTKNQQGAVADSSKTLAQQHQILTAQVTNLEANLGTALMPIFTDIAHLLVTDVVPAVEDTTKWIQQNWHWLKYAAAAVLGLWGAYKLYSGARVAVTAMSVALKAYRGEEVAASAAGAKFGGTLGSMKESGALAAVGVAAVGFAFYEVGSRVAAFLDKGSAAAFLMDGGLKDAAQSFRQALEQTNGALDKNVSLMVGQQLQSDGLAAKAEAAHISLGHLISGLTGSDSALKGLIARWKASGDPADSTLIKMEMLHTVYKAQADSAKKLGAAVAENTGKEKKAGEQQGATKTALDKTNTALGDQKVKVLSLSDALDKLSGKNLSAQQSQLQLADGLAEATQQVKDNGASLDANTAKGRSNREWLLDQLSSINDVANAEKSAGWSTKTVTDRLGENEAQLKKTAIAAGMNKDQVRQLVKEFGAVPRNVRTVMGIDDTAAQEKLTHFGDRLATIVNDDYVVYLTVDGSVTIGTRGGTGGGSSAFAQGTGYNPHAGPAMVGEHGREMVYLPRGARVATHTEAESLARMNATRGRGESGPDVHVDVHGSVVMERDLVGVIERAVRAAGGIHIGRQIRD